MSGAVGTAQIVSAGRMRDDAWYAGYAPSTAGRPPLVVVVWIPRGGFGDVAAAPVARQIVSQWFTGSPGRYVPGHSTAS